jgi:hypothetical protein
MKAVKIQSPITWDYEMLILDGDLKCLDISRSADMMKKLEVMKLIENIHPLC